MLTVWGYGTLVLYLASFGMYVWFLYTGKRVVGVAATASLVAGITVHFVALLERAYWLHTVPYRDLYGSTSLFAWLLALTYLGLEVYHRQRSVGPFVLPFVIVLVIGSMLAAQDVAIRGAPAQARGALFAWHVTLNVLAYAAFAIAFVLSAIYLLQNSVLRGRHPGATFWRFPALEVLERMSRSGVMLGVIALVLGMASGFVWSTRVEGHAWNGDAKEIASVAILVLYVAFLWLSRTTQWRGARAAILCIVNFAFVIFSYTVVNLYLTRYHRYF
jgi:ABC-type transport system involved in cytochrome c biogenesis permease subunit